MKNTSDALLIAIDSPDAANATKNASSIAKKIKKIEQLKKQIEKIKNTIATARKLYDTHCAKEEKKLLKLREQFLVKLYKRYQQKGFAQWQKEMMESKLMHSMDDLFSSGYESKVLSTIYDAISKSRFGSMDASEKEVMNEMAKDFFEGMGIDVDEEGFDFEKFSNPEFREQFGQKQSQRHAEEQEQFHEEFKNKRHVEQEQKVKTTNADFQKLYKALVKKAHPDLVTEPKEKEIREEWMKKLSQAWEERNYYQLLVLQNELGADDLDAIELNESQIKPLLRELNKEINRLEADKYKLKRHDPETSFYFENFNARSEKGILKKIMEHQDFVSFKIDEVEEEARALKTQKSTKELLTDIRDSMGAMPDEYYDELFDIF